MQLDAFQAWLVRYGDAWEARDASALAALFAPGSTLQPGPFAPAVVGRPAIRDHWAPLLERLRDGSFRAEVLGVGATYGIAHWVTTARSVDGRSIIADGVLLAAFDRSGRCTALREWWHEGSPA